MSVEALTWAWRQHVGDPGAKHVLVCLADNASSTGVCWPGKKNIAQRTEYATRTVQRHLNFLEERDLVRRIPRRRGDGTRASDLMVLSMPADAEQRANEIDAHTRGQHGRWSNGPEVVQGAGSEPAPAPSGGQDGLWPEGEGEPAARSDLASGQIVPRPVARLSPLEPSVEPSKNHHPPSPPADAQHAAPPAGSVEGGSAPPSTATPDPAPVEERVGRALDEIARRLPPGVTAPRGAGVVIGRLVAAGWTAVEIAEAATAQWPTRVAAPERLIAQRLAELVQQEAPAVTHARRMAAEQAADEAKAAERAAVDEQRAVLEERLDALDGEEAAALAREAWEQLPPAVRGPAPDLARPAVRGMARAILAERVGVLVTAGGDR